MWDLWPPCHSRLVFIHPVENLMYSSGPCWIKRILYSMFYLRMWTCVLHWLCVCKECLDLFHWLMSWLELLYLYDWCNGRLEMLNTVFLFFFIFIMMPARTFSWTFRSSQIIISTWSAIQIKLTIWYVYCIHFFDEPRISLVSRDVPGPKKNNTKNVLSFFFLSFWHI